MNIDRVIAVICILAAVTNKDGEKVEALLPTKMKDEVTDESVVMSFAVMSI